MPTPMTKDRAAAMPNSELLHDVLTLASKGLQLSELRNRLETDRLKCVWLNGPSKTEEENSLTAREKAARANESVRRKREEAAAREDETTEEFIERMDNMPLDPTPMGTQMRRILNSGWDFSGFREKSAKQVRGFLENEDLWPLSEADLSVPQRRYWRTIKTKFRNYLQGK